MGLQEEHIIDGHIRKQFKKFKGFQEIEEEPVKKKRFCTEEQKKAVSDGMKI
ncbi:MAG: hypothetical protein ACTS7C_00425 [Candidatus Hodgkinia cicadicola]